MRTKTGRSIGSCSVAAIGDSIEPEEAEWQDRTEQASFDEIIEILMTLFYGRIVEACVFTLNRKSHRKVVHAHWTPKLSRQAPPWLE